MIHYQDWIRSVSSDLKKYFRLSKMHDEDDALWFFNSSEFLNQSMNQWFFFPFVVNRTKHHYLNQLKYLCWNKRKEKFSKWYKSDSLIKCYIDDNLKMESFLEVIPLFQKNEYRRLHEFQWKKDHFIQKTIRLSGFRHVTDIFPLILEILGIINWKE